MEAFNRIYDNINFYEYRNTYDDFENLDLELVLGDLTRPIPKYTFFIPTYRRAHLLKECLESVLRQKKVKDYEIIILENDEEKNSETEKFLKKYKNNKKIFYYKVKKPSIWRIHMGVKLARSEWVSIICDDDFLMPNYLYTIDKILTKYPQMEALGCNYKTMNYDFQANSEVGDKALGFVHRLKRDIRLFWNNQFNYLQDANFISQYYYDHYYIREGVNPWLGIMYKKSNFLDVGGWNHFSYFNSCDWILNTNYLLRYNLYYTSEVLAVKREGNGNDSANKESKIDWMVVDYLYYKTFKPHLNFLEYDEKYVMAIMNNHFNMLGLKFSDIDLIVDGKKLYAESDFSSEMQDYYYQKRKEFVKKLYSKVEPLEVYTKF